VSCGSSARSCDLIKPDGDGFAETIDGMTSNEIRFECRHRGDGGALVIVPRSDGVGMPATGEFTPAIPSNAAGVAA
jgi:hypothetical protein